MKESFVTNEKVTIARLWQDTKRLWVDSTLYSYLSSQCLSFWGWEGNSYHQTAMFWSVLYASQSCYLITYLFIDITLGSWYVRGERYGDCIPQAFTNVLMWCLLTPNFKSPWRAHPLFLTPLCSSHNQCQVKDVLQTEIAYGWISRFLAHSAKQVLVSFFTIQIYPKKLPFSLQQ